VILITHCRRRFNAEKANLFSGIKQPYLLSCTSSYLAFRKSLPITHSREINFTPTLNRRRYACMARLRRKSKLFQGINNLLYTSSNLAFRNSLLITLSPEINFTPTLNRRRYACMARLRSNVFY